MIWRGGKARGERVSNDCWLSGEGETSQHTRVQWWDHVLSPPARDPHSSFPTFSLSPLPHRTFNFPPTRRPL